jgi:hypothetical protein
MKAVILAVLLVFVAADIHLDRLRLPQGFKIEVLVQNVESARQLTTTPDEQWLFSMFDSNKLTNQLVVTPNKYTRTTSSQASFLPLLMA